MATVHGFCPRSPDVPRIDALPVKEDPFPSEGVLNVKISLFTATMVAALFVGGLVAPTQAQVPAAPAAAAAPTGTRVAVIDIPYIFMNHTRFKAAIDAIKKDIDAYKEFVTEEQKRIRTESEKLEGFKPGSPEYKQMEENLARMKVELQLEGAKRQKDFMEREAGVYFNAYREVENAVAEFAQRNRIGLVLRFSAEDMDSTKRESIMQGINRIVVYQDHLNITELILARLNGSPATAGAGAAKPGTTAPSTSKVPVIPPRNLK